MFDLHIHSKVSFDGFDTGEALVQAAQNAGLKEICFADHMEHRMDGSGKHMMFDIAAYNAAYDHLEAPGLTILKGMEFGLTVDNPPLLAQDLKLRPFDFVLGSIHNVNGTDVFDPAYWEGRSIEEGTRLYLETTYACVKAHTDFDVLAHLTFPAKERCHPTHEPIRMGDWQEIVDEILRELAAKGKGLELNTSGMARCKVFLPTADYIRRFQELGGEIVTIGSDAHRADRVGADSAAACEILKDIMGYVCTFHGRNPVFHKL